MNTDDIFALVGRLFIAIIFLASAFGKITNFDGTLQFMEAHGMPAATFFWQCPGCKSWDTLKPLTPSDLAGRPPAAGR